MDTAVYRVCQAVLKQSSYTTFLMDSLGKQDAMDRKRLFDQPIVFDGCMSRQVLNSPHIQGHPGCGAGGVTPPRGGGLSGPPHVLLVGVVTVLRDQEYSNPSIDHCDAMGSLAGDFTASGGPTRLFGVDGFLTRGAFRIDTALAINLIVQYNRPSFEFRTAKRADAQCRIS